MQVPATIQAVLAARIDRLPPEEKDLLQTAAVIGNEVPLPLLQAMAERPEEGLHRSLAHLQATELLYETQLFPEPAYTFTHALTHEVAYGGLLHERRRVLHARIVEALEALAGDRGAEQVERLAHHAVRGEVWAKALAYCRQAGEKSIARSAYREAVGYVEQALSALAHLPETRHTCEYAIDLRLVMRTALSASGDNARILAYLHEAEALAATLDDPQRLGHASLFLASQLVFGMGAYEQALAVGARVLARATASGDVVLQAQAYQNRGLAYLAQGDYQQALDCFGHPVAFFDGAQRRERFGQFFLPAVSARAWLAWCHADLGTFAAGHVLGDEGLHMAEAAAHPSSLMLAAWGSGLLSLRQGDLDRARPRLERAIGLCQDIDSPATFPLIAAALGTAYTLCGCVADAVPLLTQAIEQPAGRILALYQALPQLALGEAYLRHGNLEEAHGLAESALAHARAHQERGNQAYALQLLGAIAAHRTSPDADAATAHYCQALALAKELGMRPLQAHCHRGLGHAVCDDWPARAGPCRVVDGHRDVSRYGDDLLAAGDRGGTGAGGGTVMDYQAIRAQVLAFLQQEHRVAYRILKRQFQLDDETLEDLKDDLIYAKKLAVDEDGRVLVWAGGTSSTPPTASPVPLPATPDVSPARGAAALVAPPTPDAERRQLTVMFCDLVDSTQLSSQLDPEVYRDVVRAYQSACTDVIQRYEGHIAQLLGDGLLVYFGYPHAHEDDAQRAVRTGLGMLAAIGDLNTRLRQAKGIHLAVRVGIHTGLVVVGDMGSTGRQEQLALGEVPNVCARIQGLAEPNTVAISTATYRLVQGYFECQGLGAQTLRGVAEPIAVYRVLRASGATSRLDVAQPRGLTPLVGRESEVTLLLERWEQAQAGQGQVILLSGDAGIGKSRLVQILKEHVAKEPHVRWECRSSPYYSKYGVVSADRFVPTAVAVPNRGYA